MTYFDESLTAVKIEKMKKDAKMSVIHSLLNRKIISREQFAKEQNAIFCEYSTKVDAILNAEVNDG